MNKPITIALLILVSGLTLSTTTLAEPYKRGSGYVDAISNEYSVVSVPSVRNVQSVQRSQATATFGGFNDRNSNEEVTTSSRAVVKTPISRMLSTMITGFNDRS